MRGEFAEQPLPNATFCPAHEAVVDRRKRPVFRRTIAPATAALQDVQNAADHAPIIDARLAAHVLRQIGLNPPPLFVAQPKQVAPHPLLCSESLTRSESATDSASNRFIGF